MSQIFSGAILAGGQSSRFGSDKALHLWHGKSLIEHARSGLKNCDDCFVVGGNAARYGFLGLPVYADNTVFPGALYGVARALEFATQNRVAITACDMPNLTSKYWAWLASFDCDVVICENANGLPEPLAALYSRSLLPLAEAALAKKQFKLSSWFMGANICVLPWQEVQAHFGEHIFLNANTPEFFGGI